MMNILHVLTIPITTGNQIKQDMVWEKLVAPLFKKLQLEPTYITQTAEFTHAAYQHYQDAYSNKVHMRFVVAMFGDSVLGILPLFLDWNNPKYESWSFLGSLWACEYVPPCPPDVFVKLLPYCPALYEPLLSVHWFAKTGLQSVTDTSGCFKLPCTFSAYLQGLPTKVRGNFCRCLRRNSDLQVGIGIPDTPQLAELISDYTKYCEGALDSPAMRQSLAFPQQIKLFETLSKGGQVLSSSKDSQVLSFWEGDRLLAVNYAWCNRATHTTVDSLCLRRTDLSTKKRGIGIYAILKNIQSAIIRGDRHYSLASGGQEYKRQFSAGSPAMSYLFRTGSEADVLLGNTGFYYNVHAKELVPDQPVTRSIKNLKWVPESATPNNYARTPVSHQAYEECCRVIPAIQDAPLPCYFDAQGGAKTVLQDTVIKYRPSKGDWKIRPGFSRLVPELLKRTVKVVVDNKGGIRVKPKR